jgi:hypothetical protein
MKKLLQAAFKITWLQVFVILFFSTLKYGLLTYDLDGKIQKPFIWTCLGAGLVFLLALSITAIIENRGESYESYRARMQTSVKGKLLIGFVGWGLIIPAGLAYVSFLYLFAPTSWYLFVALYAGMVIRNIIRFVSKEQGKVSQELT